MNVPVDVVDAETEIIVRADVPGLSENDLEVRVSPRALCITGKREVASSQEGKQTVYSERRSDQVFPCWICRLRLTRTGRPQPWRTAYSKSNCLRSEPARESLFALGPLPPDRR